MTSMSAQASRRQRGIALMRIARALPGAVLALAIGFSGGCSGPGEAGSDDTPVSVDPERSMNEYIQAARKGDFEGAWRSHGRLFEDARRSGTMSLPIASYCSSSAECPPIGYIGWILGKSKADLAYMDDWGCRDQAPNFFCRRWGDWVRSNKVYLGETASQSPPPAQEVDSPCRGLRRSASLDPGQDRRPDYMGNAGQRRICTGVFGRLDDPDSRRYRILRQTFSTPFATGYRQHLPKCSLARFCSRFGHRGAHSGSRHGPLVS